MVIVAGSLAIDPDQVPAFRQAVSTLEKKTRQEDGCLYYALAVDDEATGHVVVLERWRDEAALQAHLATDHVKAFIDAVGGHIKGMDAKLYDVSNERDVQV